VSLRDALLAKGLVSEKRARELGREAKEQRRQEQAQRKGKKETEAEAAKAAREAKERQVAEREAARAARAAVHDEHEHRHRVRQIVLAHRLGARGRVPFHHRIGDTGRIGCLYVPEAVARDLRAGRLAIAAFQRDDGTWEHHVIQERAAEKLATIEPSALVHFVRDRDHLTDPAENVLVRDWESSLGPHRVRDEQELAAWRR
jgi:uncharacterized protein YaiL (DUF2058 family)